MRQCREAIDAFASFDEDTAAVAAVATVRAPLGNVPFPSEADAAVAAFARLQFNLDSIDEHFRDAKEKGTATRSRPSELALAPDFAPPRRVRSPNRIPIQSRHPGREGTVSWLRPPRR